MTPADPVKLGRGNGRSGATSQGMIGVRLFILGIALCQPAHAHAASATSGLTEPAAGTEFHVLRTGNISVHSPVVSDRECADGENASHQEESDQCLG
jgi:hypothetical protein